MRKERNIIIKVIKSEYINDKNLTKFFAKKYEEENVKIVKKRISNKGYP